MGKLTINGQFSIAMFVYQRVYVGFIVRTDESYFYQLSHWGFNQNEKWLRKWPICGSIVDRLSKQ